MNKVYNKGIEVTASAPCVHCGKPDWCYRVSDTVHLCNRQVEPAQGWYKTSKTDQQNKFFYAPIHNKKAPSQIGKSIYEYKDREGNDFVRVVRINKDNGSKQIWQEHYNGKRWVKGLKGVNREDIPVYNYAQVRESISKGEPIYILEGEKCADLMISLGFTATTNLGGGGKWTDALTSDLQGATQIVLCPDRDKPGINHMMRISEDFPSASWLYVPPSEYFWDWNKIPESGGLDIADWLSQGKPTLQEIYAQITDKSPNLFLTGKIKAPEVENQQIVEPTEMHTQKAVDALFSDTAYLAVHSDLYRWTGTHYEKLSEHAQKRRILEWAKRTPQEIRPGQWKYTLASPGKIREIWDWVLFNYSVDPETINPPGINCLNGVVKIEWEGKKPTISLEPHTPEHLYTHVSNIEYDPNADETDCNRLLSALHPIQQTIFLRTIAASLDLQKIRQFNSGGVRALLCQGTGSNGKDALRQAIRVLLGEGMTHATLTDFKTYDEGRKFNLAKLEHSRINWASENSSFVKLDSIQVLKEVITGEPIDIEMKGVQDFSIDPKNICLFNINEAPLIDGGLQAIKRRYAVLDFNKTFTQNADPMRGEIEADPRFRYDPNFLNTNVCPAMLNRIIEELGNVAREGINYDAAEESLVRIQEESNHLWAFSNEIGLRPSPGDRIYIKDLYERLRAWYIDNGTLELRVKGENVKEIWHDQARKSDSNVTAANQLYKRLKVIFSQIEKKRHTESNDRERKGQYYILGLAIFGEADGEAETQSYQRGEDGEAKLTTLSRIMMRVENLTEHQRLQVLGFMDKVTNEPQIQNEVEDFASPSSPSRPVSDSASPSASPLQDASSSSQDNSNLSINATVENQLTVNIPNQIFSNENTTEGNPVNTINKFDPSKQLEWVLMKDGKRLLVEDINGLKFTGRQSGVKNASQYWLDDAVEFHYKDEKEAVKT